MTAAVMRLFDGREISLDRTNIMGIVNVTDDSFYDPSRARGAAAVERALRMADEGADVIDIGAESTRPGSLGVPLDEEIEALVAVIAEVRRALPHMPISVDTRKAEAASRAIEAGADIINDVSGLELTSERDAMIRVAAETGAAYVLTHTKGEPHEMTAFEQHADILGELLIFYAQKIDLLKSGGVLKDRIILDPGIGFAKDLRANIDVIANVGELRRFGLPILVGASRKRFVSQLSQECGYGELEPESRLAGTLAVSAFCAAHGVEILRVHDVTENLRAVRMTEALMEARHAV